MDAFIYYILAFILFILCAFMLILFNFVPWQYSLRGLLLLLMAIIILILSAFIRVQAIPYENAKKLRIKLKQFNNQQLDYHI